MSLFLFLPCIQHDKYSFLYFPPPPICNVSREESGWCQGNSEHEGELKRKRSLVEILMAKRTDGTKPGNSLPCINVHSSVTMVGQVGQGTQAHIWRRGKDKFQLAMLVAQQLLEVSAAPMHNCCRSPATLLCLCRYSIVTPPTVNIRSFSCPPSLHCSQESHGGGCCSPKL